MRLRAGAAFVTTPSEPTFRKPFMNRVETRLAELGLTLPQPVAPIATYVPFVKTGHLLHISGQVSTDADGGIKGTVGEDVDLETAQKAARICALNLVAQMK